MNWISSGSWFSHAHNLSHKNQLFVCILFCNSTSITYTLCCTITISMYSIFKCLQFDLEKGKLPLLPLQIKYSYNFSIITFIISNPHAFIKSCKILPQTMKGIYGMRITITITWWILSYFQYLRVILRKLKDKMLLERKRGWESKPRETQ